MFGKSAFCLRIFSHADGTHGIFRTGCRRERHSEGPGQRRRPEQFGERSQRHRQCSQDPTAPAAEHSGARGAFCANGFRPPVAEVSADRDKSEPAGRVLAPRISSLVFPCRDPRPGQVDRSKDEHLQGLLEAV